MSMNFNTRKLMANKNFTEEMAEIAQCLSVH